MWSRAFAAAYSDLVRRFFFPLAIGVAVLSGCGSSGDESANTTDSPVATSSATPTSPTPTSTPASEEGPEVTTDGVTVSGPKGGQPSIAVTPGTAAPSQLVVVDVYEGDGAEIEAGGAGQFNYEGVLFSDGVPFDSSWTRGEPISFGLDQVIPGWQEGIVGMREGGRRLLIVPPDLAYGQRALGGIPPNSTLVFVVDLNRVLD